VKKVQSSNVIYPHNMNIEKDPHNQTGKTSAEQIEGFCNIQSFDLHSKLMLYGSSRARIFKTCTLQNSLLLYPYIIPGGPGGGGEARETVGR
jgi:hypothetical protein